MIICRCIHIATNGISFFFVAEKYSIVYMFHIFEGGGEGGVELLYTVVSVSAIQQSESAIQIHISQLLFGICFPFWSPQSCAIQYVLIRYLLYTAAAAAKSLQSCLTLCYP